VTIIGPKAAPFKKSLSTGHRLNLVDMSKKYVSIATYYECLSLNDLNDQELLGKISGSRNTKNLSLEDKKLIEESERLEMMEKKRKEDLKKIESNKNLTQYDPSNFVKGSLDLNWTGKEELKKKCLELYNNENNLKWFKFNVEGYLLFLFLGKDWTNLKFHCDGFDTEFDEEWKKKHLNEKSVHYIIISITSSELGYGIYHF
jgi:hypothetical protein